MKRIWRVAAYCIGPLVMVCGWYIGVLENEATENLVRGKGKIITSVLREGDGSQEMKVFVPEITYSYRVNGTEYSSHSITMTPVHFTSKMEAERITERYRPAAPVQIFYDRTNPSRAYLETGAVGNGGLTVALGVIISLILIPLLYLSGRRNSSAILRTDRDV